MTDKRQTMTASELANRIKRGEKWALAEPDTFESSADALRNTPLRQALAERDKLIEIAQEILSDAEEYEFEDGLGVSISMDLYSRLAAAVDADESDTGTDRGAWSDVHDATKWVDELRGGDEEFECPRCGHCCWTPEDLAYRPSGLSAEEPPNSTTDVVKPIYQISMLKSPESMAWIDVDKQIYDDAGLYLEYARRVLYTAPQKEIGEIVEAHGLIGVSIPEMPPVGTKLYTAPPKREWVGLTDEEISIIVRDAAQNAATRRDGTTSQRIARAVEAKLKEKNNG